MPAGRLGGPGQGDGSSLVVRLATGLEIAGMAYWALVLPWDGRSLMARLRMPHRLFATTYLRHPFAMSLKRLG
jgi:hypothetical protein